jgi:hypothetical protein
VGVSGRMMPFGAPAGCQAMFEAKPGCFFEAKPFEAKPVTSRRSFEAKL